MKRRSKDLLLSYILSVIFIILSYIFIYNLYISLILGLMIFILMNFYVFKKIKKTKIFKKSLSKFSQFSNSLIMQITVTPNVSTSINEISDFLDNSEKNILQNDELLVNEKLDSIEQNYNFPLYQVFKEIIILYDTQGGNIIDMSMQLLSQIDIYIKNVESISLDNLKKIGEVLILWTFSFIALFYIRQVLFEYYIVIINEQIFKLIVTSFFILFIFSIYILSKKYIEIKLGE